MENKDKTQYKQLICNRCGAKHLAKVTQDREFFKQMIEKPEAVADSVAYMIMRCCLCGETKWPVTDHMEILDVY